VNPKAFVSHATLDQDRFVRGFAERLQANGVDTWYSGWSLADGDSLVEKIFDEGIGEADTVIVVLSLNSISSNWVRAELNVAIVRMISKRCRLIPVIIDDVTVPVALEATKYRKIADVANYDVEFDGLLRAIFNESGAPPVGPQPRFTSALRMPGLDASDVAVLEELALSAIDAGVFVDGAQLEARCAARDVTPAAVIVAIHAIEERGLIKEARVHIGRIQYVHVRLRLVERYVRATYPDVDGLERRLIARIVNDTSGGRIDLTTIARDVGVERLVAKSLLEPLASRKLIDLVEFLGDQVYTDGCSPLLERLLR
jgi:hypothetical protein